MEKDCCVLEVITPGSDAEFRERHPTKSLIKAGRRGQHKTTLQKEHSLLLFPCFFILLLPLCSEFGRGQQESRGNPEKSNIIH